MGLGRMECVIVQRKVSYIPMRDGIDVYHACLYHGSVVNHEVDDNNLGDKLSIKLQLEKNAYDCRYIIQPHRNLIVPEGAKRKLEFAPNIAFFPVVFTKLFYVPFHKGDFALGPETFDDLQNWLDAFPHDEGLRREIEDFYELILPRHDRLVRMFHNLQRVRISLASWRDSSVDLSREMLSSYPVIWEPEGIIFRRDVFDLIQEFFCWDFFRRAQFALI